MYDGRQLLCFSSIREKITFNENALLRDQRKKWVLLENQHYIPNIEDIFTKFTRHPMNWTNMMSSKGQVYASVDSISKTKGLNRSVCACQQSCRGQAERASVRYGQTPGI